MPIDVRPAETLKKALRDPFVPSLWVGTAGGAAGLAYGGVAGLLKEQNPFLYSLSTGIKWSGLATGFWCEYQST